MHTEIKMLDKPIERIRKACELDDDVFERQLSTLETYLEGLIANAKRMKSN